MDILAYLAVASMEKTVLRLSKVGEQQHCDWLIFIIFFDNGLLTHYRGI